MCVVKETAPTLRGMKVANLLEKGGFLNEEGGFRNQDFIWKGAMPHSYAEPWGSDRALR
jgi:hypothetical protein